VDEEVLRGDLKNYDWLHLHHEDFTGQHGKFYTAYHAFPWYKEEEAVQEAMARKLGFAKVTPTQGRGGRGIKDYIGRGGFMFGMCSATDTYDLALAAVGVDIADVVYDNDAPDPAAQKKLDYSRTLAFKDFRLEMDPFIYRFSGHRRDAGGGAARTQHVLHAVRLLAKNDPVPTMLIQDHVNAVPEFLGQTTGFRKTRMKSGVAGPGRGRGHRRGEVSARPVRTRDLHVPRRPRSRGLPAHGRRPATDLSRYKHSPGYRLILNNVLFPAAEKKKQRT
jgi:hypothetical protein